MSPSFCSIDPKYRKVSFRGTTCPSRLTSYSSSRVIVLKPDFMYSVLVLLSLKPFDYKVCLQNTTTYQPSPTVSIDCPFGSLLGFLELYFIFPFLRICVLVEGVDVQTEHLGSRVSIWVPIYLDDQVSSLSKIKNPGTHA
jgi:hypothetical protein